MGNKSYFRYFVLKTLFQVLKRKFARKRTLLSSNLNECSSLSSSSYQSHTMELFLKSHGANVTAKKFIRDFKKYSNPMFDGGKGCSFCTLVLITRLIGWSKIFDFFLFQDSVDTRFRGLLFTSKLALCACARSTALPFALEVPRTHNHTCDRI